MQSHKVDPLIWTLSQNICVMEPSSLIIISSDEEDNKAKTLLDRKRKGLGSSTVRDGAAIKTSQQLLQSQDSPMLPWRSPRRPLIRSKSAEVLGFQPEINKSVKRAVSASCLACTPRGYIRAPKSPVANEKRQSIQHQEPAGFKLIKQPLVHTWPHTTNELSPTTIEPNSTHALVEAPITKFPFHNLHTSSQPQTTATGTMGYYWSATNPFVLGPPYLNPLPEEEIRPLRPPCLNLIPWPYLKYPYLAASKAAAPQQYVSPDSNPHPKEISTQRLNLDGLSMAAVDSSALKRKAGDNIGNAPKRMKNETVSATPSQISSPARSKLSKASESSAALSSSRPPRNRAWTSVMLVDFADTLRKSFDFNAFAAKHGKAAKDIRDTFEMVVSKPIFEHSSRGMARAKMQTFNQKLRDFVAWTNRGGRDVHGELTTSPWKLSSTAKAKAAESKAKEAESTAKGKKGEKAAKAGSSKGKGPATPKRPRALKATGEPLVYKDGIYR